jgi:hypothetical protein
MDRKHRPDLVKVWNLTGSHRPLIPRLLIRGILYPMFVYLLHTEYTTVTAF